MIIFKEDSVKSGAIVYGGDFVGLVIRYARYRANKFRVMENRLFQSRLQIIIKHCFRSIIML